MKQLFLALSLGLFSSVGFAQWDVGNREEIAVAAHELSEAAEHFHEVIHDLDGYSHLAVDVHRFADTAEHFHETVESGAPANHIRRDFQQVRQFYHHIQTSLSRAHQIHHNDHVMYDWEHVQYAFQDLSRQMRYISHPHNGGHSPTSPW